MRGPPSTWSNIVGVFAAPCYMCGAETEDRVAVGDDGGCAPICSLVCEFRFEGERQAVNGICAYLEGWAKEAELVPGPPQYEDALRDAAEHVRKGEWRKP